MYEANSNEETSVVSRRARYSLAIQDVKTCNPGLLGDQVMGKGCKMGLWIGRLKSAHLNHHGCWYPSSSNRVQVGCGFVGWAFLSTGSGGSVTGEDQRAVNSAEVIRCRVVGGELSVV